MKPLLYHDKPMDADATDPPRSAILEALMNREPVMLVLEPGDATRYTLLLVPAWAPRVRGQLGHYGVPAGESARYLLVILLDGNHSGTLAWAGQDVGEWDLPFHNDWTRALLTWWLRGLWEDIAALRKDG